MKKRLIGLICALLSFTSCMSTISARDDDLGSAEVYVTAKEGIWDQRMPDIRFNHLDSSLSSNYIKIYPDNLRQEFLGVGGAITESAAYNISKLSKDKQKLIYDAYYGKDGAQYSIIRSSIGSADFSIKQYSYNDTEKPDEELKNFTIEKDHDFIIPAIKQALSYNKNIKFFAAPWAPPAWMKKSGIRRGQTGTAALKLVNNDLNPKYYQSYANYFVKYIQEYKKQGIDVYSLSIQNESQNNPKWEATTWSIKQTIDFVGNYLGPTLEKHKLNPELLIWDWDKGNDPMHGDGFIKYNLGVLSDAKARKYIDGIAFHWYAGDVWHELKGVPMWSKDFYSLDTVKKAFPNINLHATEGCQEKGPWINSYDPADRYTYDILNDFDHGTKSWIDWNIVLDSDGGPTQGVINKCHAPIMIDKNNNVMIQPSYYILKRISKEIQPGTKSIESKTDLDISKSASIDKNGNISLMIGNKHNKNISVNVVDGKRSLSVNLKPHSMTTVKFKKNKNTPENKFNRQMYVKPIDANATSYEKNPIYDYSAKSAIDNSLKTRWASDWKDNEAITFELVSKELVSGVSLNFENGYNSSYDIQTSTDGINFKTVKHVNYHEFNNSKVEVKFQPTEANYVRIQGRYRSNKYGYSIYDAKVLINV